MGRLVGVCIRREGAREVLPCFRAPLPGAARLAGEVVGLLFRSLGGRVLLMKTNDSQVNFDVLAWAPLRRALLRPGFPFLLQIGALGILLVLVAVGFGGGVGVSARDLMILRKTNLTTLVVWGLWWPGMIAVALAFGRAWCMACPMELVNRISDTIARKTGLPRMKLGKFLGAGWLVVIGYVVLQLLVAGLSMHRIPHATAVLLLALIGAAFLAGLLFRESRSFCRACCPASALLSVYGRHTPLQLEMRNQSTCSSCTTRGSRQPGSLSCSQPQCGPALRAWDFSRVIVQG